MTPCKQRGIQAVWTCQSALGDALTFTFDHCNITNVVAPVHTPCVEHRLNGCSRVTFVVSCHLTDHSSGNTSLDTLLALLQAEGAKIEEETEVSMISLSLWMTSYVPVTQSVIRVPAFPVADVSSQRGFCWRAHGQQE